MSSWLCLCTNFFRWTKLLPKSGSKFIWATNHLKAAGLPSIAEKYQDIASQVIEHELTALTQPMRMAQSLEFENGHEILSSEQAVHDFDWGSSHNCDEEALFRQFINEEV